MIVGAVLAIVAMVGLLVLVVRRARASSDRGVNIEAWREKKESKEAGGETNVVWALTGPPPPPSPPGLMASRTW